MTDGILLAETQGDRAARGLRHDHRRRGARAQPQHRLPAGLSQAAAAAAARPEADRHVGDDRRRALRAPFRHCRRPAPVIEVSGRMYPVEVRYRPLGRATRRPTTKRSSRRRSSPPPRICGAKVRATSSCSCRASARSARPRELAAPRHWRGGPTRSALEILPLYARLSVDEQQRVFAPSGGRRIVLATNVAETSLTVPGHPLRDRHRARARQALSLRNKTTLLQIEKISQAAANQRAGRCGRVADGICVRLYGEEDFAARPRVHRSGDPAQLARRR